MALVTALDCSCHMLWGCSQHYGLGQQYSSLTVRNVPIPTRGHTAPVTSAQVPAIEDAGAMIPYITLRATTFASRCYFHTKAPTTTTRIDQHCNCNYRKLGYGLSLHSPRAAADVRDGDVNGRCYRPLTRWSLSTTEVELQKRCAANEFWPREYASHL